jgi:hypothetical protein
MKKEITIAMGIIGVGLMLGLAPASMTEAGDFYQGKPSDSSSGPRPGEATTLTPGPLLGILASTFRETHRWWSKTWTALVR